MSIKGIDTQIMVQRTTDFVREASSAQRHPEAAQEHLAAQGKIESNVDQSRVAATTESEMEEIRTDVDEEGSGASGGGSGQEEEEMTEEQKRELLVAPADHDQLIDIYL